MAVYYIYEIPGKKVGCTMNLISRVRSQGGLESYKVLDTTTDIEEASKLERYWQEQLGYPLDFTAYAKSYVNGKQAGSIAKSEEHRRKLAEYAGKKNSQYGSGRRYRELSTGFEGYASDHAKYFNVGTDYIVVSGKRGIEKKYGKFKGKTWVVI